MVNERRMPHILGERPPEKILMHDKEREFFDCLRLIIQNGYLLDQKDFTDIFNFIKFNEIMYFEEREQENVIQFFKDAL